MRSSSEAVAQRKNRSSGRAAAPKKNRSRTRAADRKFLTFALVRKMLLAFPGVTEGPCYGTPGFRVGKKFLTRLHQAGDSMVVKVASIDERDMLLEADPRVFHITEHYRNYPALLVRIAAVEPDVLRAMMERNWRLLASKKAVAAFDTGRA
jgi:hypothetical protein